jgi:hypothetical protein
MVTATLMIASIAMAPRKAAPIISARLCTACSGNYIKPISG